MPDLFAPVGKQSLSDQLAQRICELIRGNGFKSGDRLPSIMEMARQFGVGHPTIREALKKLETMGIVEIRHGSGVFVLHPDDVLVLAAPEYAGAVTKDLLLDVIRTRLPLEVVAVEGAVHSATDKQLADMRGLLECARTGVVDVEGSRMTNLAFHRRIADASGNRVLSQLLTALHDLFPREQRVILSLGGERERDHGEHMGILEALEQRNRSLAVDRMRQHLLGVEAAVRAWDPERNPVSDRRA